jgi:hypothetical protein
VDVAPPARSPARMRLPDESIREERRCKHGFSTTLPSGTWLKGIENIGREHNHKKCLILLIHPFLENI